MRAEPFALPDVRCSTGRSATPCCATRRICSASDTDRLLHNFRVNAGIPSSAKPYGGWEEPKGELRGHSVGHYLSACALMYASTGDRGRP